MLSYPFSYPFPFLSYPFLSTSYVFSYVFSYAVSYPFPILFLSCLCYSLIHRIPYLRIHFHMFSKISIFVHGFPYLRRWSPVAGRSLLALCEHNTQANENQQKASDRRPATGQLPVAGCRSLFPILSLSFPILYSILPRF